MSLQDAVRALDPQFEVYGSSPEFLTDWRWYKSIPDDRRSNAMAVRLADQNIHNFLDYRFTYPPQSVEINHQIASLCEVIFTLMKKFEVSYDNLSLEDLHGNLMSLAEVVRKYSKETAASLEDFAGATQRYLLDQSFPELKEFVSFFGRGTQYLSFIRTEVSD